MGEKVTRMATEAMEKQPLELITLPLSVVKAKSSDKPPQIIRHPPSEVKTEQEKRNSLLIKSIGVTDLKLHNDAAVWNFRGAHTLPSDTAGLQVNTRQSNGTPVQKVVETFSPNLLVSHNIKVTIEKRRPKYLFGKLDPTPVLPIPKLGHQLATIDNNVMFAPLRNPQLSPEPAIPPPATPQEKDSVSNSSRASPPTLHKPTMASRSTDTHPQFKPTLVGIFDHKPSNNSRPNDLHGRVLTRETWNKGIEREQMPTNSTNNPPPPYLLLKNRKSRIEDLLTDKRVQAALEPYLRHSHKWPFMSLGRERFLMVTGISSCLSPHDAVNKKAGYHHPSPKPPGEDSDHTGGVTMLVSADELND